MTVRKILSAKSARPKVEGMLEALVDAAVFIGGSDGQFGEPELEVFIDTMREVVSAAVGEEFVETMASTPRLLTMARKARATLTQKGKDAFLAELAPRFQGSFGRDGLVLAWRVVLADGRVTATEAAAFEAFAAALHIDVDEVRVLKDLASRSEAASQLGHRGESIEKVLALVDKGWTKVPGGPELGFDAGLEFRAASGGGLRLELDATQSALHVHVLKPDGAGPQLVCLFHDHLPGLLAVLDALRGSFDASTFAEKLQAIRAVCPDVFVEHQGRFGQH
ncbi:MAG: hypothetical protein U0228_10390 [Myxococcaceae bacterium]